MEEMYLDYVLVPAGLLVLGIYHIWLLFTIIRRPTTTVIGLNSFSRYQWVHHMMKVSPFFHFLFIYLFTYFPFHLIEVYF